MLIFIFQLYFLPFPLSKVNVTMFNFQDNFLLTYSGQCHHCTFSYHLCVEGSFPMFPFIAVASSDTQKIALRVTESVLTLKSAWLLGTALKSCEWEGAFSFPLAQVSQVKLWVRGQLEASSLPSQQSLTVPCKLVLFKVSSPDICLTVSVVAHP